MKFFKPLERTCIYLAKSIGDRAVRLKQMNLKEEDDEQYQVLLALLKELVNIKNENEVKDNL